MEIFAKLLRDRAAELEISHAEAARRSGLDERRYSHYVSGIREPDLATLSRIAVALETTPNDLLGFGAKTKAAPRMILFDRLNSAAQLLSDAKLEIVVIQTEALSDQQTKKRRPVKPER